MASLLRTWGVPISIVIGSILIAISYVVPHLGNQQISSAFTPSKAEADSTDDLLKSLATKDSDGDGLPDWEEVLYGTDPNKVISTTHGIPDGEAVKEGLLSLKTTVATSTDTVGIPQPAPGINSLTDAFAKAFFQQYIQSGGGQSLDAATQQKLVASLIAQFVASAPNVSSHYTMSSVKTSATTTADTYGGALGIIFQKNDVAPENADPIALAQSLTVNNDFSARAKLLILADTYRAIMTDMLATPVPPSLAAQHLAMIRAFDELSQATRAVANFNEDPLSTLVMLSVYRSAFPDFNRAMGVVARAIQATGAVAAKDPAQVVLRYAEKIHLL